MKTKLLTLLLIAAPGFAQSTVKDALVKHWKATGELTLAVAKAMPAESYNFRPNPEEMTFGQLMAHIGVANALTCGLPTGMKPPAMPEKIAAQRKDPKPDVDKDTAVQYLTEVFAYCGQSVAAVTPEQLDKTFGTAPRQMTGFEWLWSYFTHTAHHRGQAEVYLRVKGIKPPEYTF